MCSSLRWLHLSQVREPSSRRNKFCHGTDMLRHNSVVLRRDGQITTKHDQFSSSPSRQILSRYVTTGRCCVTTWLRCVMTWRCCVMTWRGYVTTWRTSYNEASLILTRVRHVTTWWRCVATWRALRHNMTSVVAWRGVCSGMAWWRYVRIWRRWHKYYMDVL